MPLREELKALIIKSGFTMTAVVNAINEKYGRNESLDNFSSKLRRGTLKYAEVEQVLDVIGYKIVWEKI